MGESVSCSCALVQAHWPGWDPLSYLALLLSDRVSSSWFLHCSCHKIKLYLHSDLPQACVGVQVNKLSTQEVAEEGQEFTTTLGCIVSEARLGSDHASKNQLKPKAHAKFPSYQI